MSGRPSIFWRTQHLPLLMRILEIVGTQAPILRYDVEAEFTVGEQPNVKRCINELIAFGAIRQTGKFISFDRDTRTLAMTELGAAWDAREMLPHIRDDPDDIAEYFDD